MTAKVLLLGLLAPLFGGALTASFAVAINVPRRCVASSRLRSASVRRVISARSWAVVSNCQETSRAMCVTQSCPDSVCVWKAFSRNRAARAGRFPAAGSFTWYSVV